MAARAPAEADLEARQHLLPAARRAARPSGGRHARPRASARSASIRRPQGFGAATDLAWYGERKLPGIICGPGRLAQCHVADEYLETEQLSLACAGVRADARRLVRVGGRAMRALVYTLERTLDVLDVETPVPATGEVLIRVERAGICGSDVQGVATRSPRRAPPLIMGHELVGEVTAAAPGAEALVGRRVAVNPQVPCRACLALPLRVARTSASIASSSAGARPGGFGELVAVPVTLRPRDRRRAGRRRRGAGRAASPRASTRFGSSPLALPGTVVVLGAGTIGMLTLHRRPPARRRADRRQRAGRGTPRAGPPASRTRRSIRTGSTHAVGQGARARRRRGRLRRDAAPRPSRCCSPGGCALWLGMHDAEATIPAFDLVVREQSIRGSSPTPTPTSRARSSCWPSIRTRSACRRGPARWRRARPCSRSSWPATTGGFVKASLAPSRGQGARREVRRC